MSAMTPGMLVDDAALTMFPYSFRTRAGSDLRFSSFASAWGRALRMDRLPVIYFRDAKGVEHVCRNIPGQEGRRDL